MRKRFLSCALAVCLVLGLFAPLEGLTLRAEAVTASKVPAHGWTTFWCRSPKRPRRPLATRPSGMWTTCWPSRIIPTTTTSLWRTSTYMTWSGRPCARTIALPAPSTETAMSSRTWRAPTACSGNAEEATIKDVGVKYADIDAEFTDQSFGTIGGIVADARGAPAFKTAFLMATSTATPAPSGAYAETTPPVNH